MAASVGTLYLTGASGRNYSVAMYLPDAVGGIVLFNPTGAATSASPNYFRPEEDVTIRDVVIVTGTTATGAAFTSNGAQFSGNSILYAAHLTTINNRPFVGWKFRGLSLVGAVQT